MNQADHHIEKEEALRTVDYISKYGLSEEQVEIKRLKATVKALEERRDVVDDLRNEVTRLREEVQHSSELREEQDVYVRKLTSENKALKAQLRVSDERK